MGSHKLISNSMLSNDLQNAFAQQSKQMQNNIYGQLQGLLAGGQLGLQGGGLGSVGNQLQSLDEIKYIPGIELMKKSLGAPTRALKLRNEEWLDSKIMQYRGNLQ